MRNNPLLSIDEFSTYQGMVYRITNEYRPREAILVDFKTLSHFEPLKNINEPHAYGILTSIYNTRLLPLDIDQSPDGDKVLATWVTRLKEYETITDIDIVATSYIDGEPVAWHVYAGLDEPRDISSFYTNLPFGLCTGFINCAIRNHEVVTRVSRKFNMEHGSFLSTLPKWTEGWTRNGEKEWIKLPSFQLIAPLGTADGVSLNALKGKPVLRLRG